MSYGVKHIFAKPAWRFLKKTLVHKFHVFRFGLRTKAPLWRLFIHDWTKLSPSEFPFYAAHLCGGLSDELAFAQAWNHHSKSNPHHWEYWIPVTSHTRSNLPLEPLPMPEWAVREMLADWLAASYFTQGREIVSIDTWDWFNNEKAHKLRLHPVTWTILNKVTDEYFSSLR